MGNLQDFESDRLGFLLAARDKYGAVVAFDGRTTIINDAQLAKKVLQDPSGGFEVRENFLLSRLSAAQVDEVLEMRTLLSPSLRPAVTSGAIANTAALTNVWIESQPPGTRASFNPLHPMEWIISRVVAAHYFGPDAPLTPGPTGQLLDALQNVIGNPFALPAAWNTPSRRRIRRRHADLHSIVEELLEVRARDPGNYVDLATSVVVARDPERHSLTRTADLLIGSLLAAQRVPAATASWLMMLMADNPNTQTVVRSEAKAFADSLGAGEPGRPEQFPMALATVLECMRLYPATWSISRAATRQVDLASYSFEEGHQFLISPYVIHRDPAYFPHPLEFDPGRWLKGPRPALAYLPFGRGRHACPGGSLVTAMLVAILLTVVGRRIITRVPGLITPNPRTTLLPDGLMVHLNLVPTGDGELRGRTPLDGALSESLPDSLARNAEDFPDLRP